MFSCAFGSIVGPCWTTHRNAAWICPPGQPKRSYKSMCRKAVSRSSWKSRCTTRRPTQTHSGLPAGPVICFETSARSFNRCASRFACSAACCFALSAASFWADAGVEPTHMAKQRRGRARRKRGDMMLGHSGALARRWMISCAVYIGIRPQCGSEPIA